MFVKVLAVIGFVAVASAADLSVGAGGGKLIFEQNITASPAIWQQVKTVSVNASNSTDEVISRVVVIDNRPEKDGEAKVTEGGAGHKNVTIELKSPAVFRGLDFSVQVFADEENTQVAQHPKTTGFETQNPQLPKDLNVDENQKPKDGDDIILGAPKPTVSSTTQVNKDDQQKIQPPTLVGKDQPTRLYRDTEEQKTKDQATVTPVEADATKDIKVNENATKTVADIDENLKKALDSIFENNKTDDTQKTLPVMPQAESDDLSILRDDEENRKVRQAAKGIVVPALPKELDDHTTAKSELSSSTTAKSVAQEKNVPKVVSEVSSTTSSDNLKTKLPEDVKTTQELEQNIKGPHFGHHHAVPLPYVN
ncbi:hypothetical protein PYW07_010425 [Mythimna separata]|uniref:Uncharacterized protein n=1 Tax=Mythimna separata TaxID=271217 RepID=A0AAD8DM86_MYTSE|nr:hypothetical protein PYW07_010425 [Mythimna separata]